MSDVREVIQAQLHPHNVEAVVVGDDCIEDMERLVLKYLGSVPPPATQNSGAIELAKKKEQQSIATTASARKVHCRNIAVLRHVLSGITLMHSMQTRTTARRLIRAQICSTCILSVFLIALVVVSALLVHLYLKDYVCV